MTKDVNKGTGTIMRKRRQHENRINNSEKEPN